VLWNTERLSVECSVSPRVCYGYRYIPRAGSRVRVYICDAAGERASTHRDTTSGIVVSWRAVLVASVVTPSPRHPVMSSPLLQPSSSSSHLSLALAVTSSCRRCHVVVACRCAVVSSLCAGERESEGDDMLCRRRLVVARRCVSRRVRVVAVVVGTVIKSCRCCGEGA